MNTRPTQRSIEISGRGLLLTGGSGLLALNWACAMRGTWSVTLALHEHDVHLDGANARRVDLESVSAIGSLLERLDPGIVVHAAGMASVDTCEADPGRALRVNVNLARNLAEAAAERSIPLVHISTDHLFSGAASFYSEEASAAPLNVYGSTKLAAEDAVLKAHPNALAIRTNFFGWGHRYRVSFSDWILEHLRQARPLTLFDDVYFTPILIDDLAVAVHELVERGVNGVFNVVGDERISKHEFALRLAHVFALPTSGISRGKLASAKLRAARPRDMSLDNTKASRVLGRSLGRLDDYFSALKLQEQQGRSAELRSAVCKPYRDVNTYVEPKR